MNNIGEHATGDIYLNEDYSNEQLIKLCIQAIEKSGMTIVDSIIKEFKPYGLTGVWILSESHFTIHTYPEHNYISVDCYTCGEEGDPISAISHLADCLDVNEFKSKYNFLQRG